MVLSLVECAAGRDHLPKILAFSFHWHTTNAMRPLLQFWRSIFAHSYDLTSFPPAERIYFPDEPLYPPDEAMYPPPAEPILSAEPIHPPSLNQCITLSRFPLHNSTAIKHGSSVVRTTSGQSIQFEQGVWFRVATSELVEDFRRMSSTAER